MGMLEEEAAIRFIENDEDSVAFHRRDHENRKKFKKENYILIVLTILLIVISLASVLCFVNMSFYRMSPDILLAQIKVNVGAFYEWVSGADSRNNMQLYTLQYVIGIMSGASLGLAGVIYQGVLKNQLASPGTLGIQAGGLAGNLIYVIFFFKFTATGVISYDSYMSRYLQQEMWERNLQPIIILIGCMITLTVTVGVSTLAGRHGRISSGVMILMGTLFSTLVSGAVSVAQYYFITKDATDPRLLELRMITMGSLSKSFNSDQLIIMLIVFIPCSALLLSAGRRMNVFAFGEEEALAMGMNVNQFRFIMLTVATLLTAIVISLIGQIALIGFIVPHIVRKLVGPDFSKLLPCALLLGGVLMVIIQDIAVVLGFEMYLNVVTSVAGSLCMLTIMMSKRRKPYGAY